MRGFFGSAPGARWLDRIAAGVADEAIQAAAMMASAAAAPGLTRLIAIAIAAEHGWASVAVKSTANVYCRSGI
jgi:hypothetical protein